MSRICQITGKRPLFGNRRSHAMNATKRLFIPNLHTRRFWIHEEHRFVTLRVSAKGIRILDKKGIKGFPFLFRCKNRRKDIEFV